MSYHQLSTEERHQIAAMRVQRLGIVEMALVLGRHRSTLYRELRRNASAHDGHYRASHSEQQARARQHRARSRPRFGAAAFAAVEGLLREQLSPEQIVGRRRLEGLPVMSHETIYRWIWKDKAAGGELWMNLRGARKQRRKRYGAQDSRGRLAGKTMIGSRPAEVERRARLGDWEIDTVHGQGVACVLTVVERRSGLRRLGPLSRATKEETTRRTLRLLRQEPHPGRTITADNGGEFHDYRKIEAGLQARFYFATPHHAWERGTNENTNGLLRQYLPKGSDLAGLTQAQCRRLAQHLNHRPRKRLGFKTPHEVYHSLPVVALRG